MSRCAEKRIGPSEHSAAVRVRAGRTEVLPGDRVLRGRRTAEEDSQHAVVLGTHRLEDNEAAAICHGLLSLPPHRPSVPIRMQQKHSDIKPENLVLETDDIESNVKVIDFGTSKIFKHREVISGVLGTVLVKFMNSVGLLHRTGGDKGEVQREVRRLELRRHHVHIPLRSSTLPWHDQRRDHEERGEGDRELPA